jgi:prephenate dehydrogenase
MGTQSYKKSTKVSSHFPPPPDPSRKRTDSADSPITPLIDGHAVSRISDFIIYSVESSSIIPIVREYGPSTKMGATVAGQTSVKAPEKEAFEKYLPGDVDIVSVHSLHGPTVTTEGQPLVSPPECSSADSRSSSIIVDLRKRFEWSKMYLGALNLDTSI